MRRANHVGRMLATSETGGEHAGVRRGLPGQHWATSLFSQSLLTQQVPSCWLCSSAILLRTSSTMDLGASSKLYDHNGNLKHFSTRTGYQDNVRSKPSMGKSATLSRKKRLRPDVQTISSNVAARQGKSLTGPLRLGITCNIGRGARSCGKFQPQQAIVHRKILPYIIEDVAPAPSTNLAWSEAEGPGMHFRAPPTSSPSKYHCTKPSCKATFKRAHDWKKHEKKQHEQCEAWKCLNCHEEFWEATRFGSPHRAQHDCALQVLTNCQHTEEACHVPLRKVAWGCGFCGVLHSSWDARCSHIARHFERELHFDSSGKGIRGREKSEWDTSLEIRALLEREELAVHFQMILAQAYPVEWQQNG